MLKSLRWATGVVLLIAGPMAAAVKIEKVLPFTPDVDALRVVVQIEGGEKVQLKGTIVPAGGGGAVWEGQLGDGSSEKLIKWLKVQPWSPGSPKLYQLTVKAADGASKTVRFGFRKVESKSGNVYLNGKPIFLRGLAINPPGRTVPDAVGETRQFAYDYVKYLRGQNVNLIRLTHDNQDWFDVCDELGMMVYRGFYGSPPTGLSRAEEAAQAALETQDEAAGKKLPINRERSFKAYRETFQTYVRHPSIVIYVLANEMPYKGETGKRVHDFLTAAHDRLSKWDGTRLYIGNAGYGEGHQGDINDVHRYWGWYYNSFLTYYNLRDPKLFGDPKKSQPFTFSECVGNFTGPDGAYNCIERKQLGAALTWTGTAGNQIEEAQSYQAFMNKQAIESFRRMRAVNPRISGLMPFTITFHNWRGIKSFDQMKPTAAAKQFGVSYQPVLLSFEHWQPNVYAGKTTRLFAHVINDADDFSDLKNARLEWELRGGDARLRGALDIPTVAYYSTWRGTIDLALPTLMKGGPHTLIGRITRGGKTISTNETTIFIAGTDWSATSQPSKRLPQRGVDGLDPAADTLLIAEGEWQRYAQDKEKIRDFVRAGGRVLCFGQDFKEFDTSWLPANIQMCEASLNDTEYGGTQRRPTRDGMHVNPQRPDHPVFKGVDRERLKLWSDATQWDQTKDGFPHVYPIEFGFKLTRQQDLANVAILADYDQGLSGVALCEMFDGRGSVLLCGFGLNSRAGVDPIADRMLSNLIAYMTDDQGHEKHPRVTEPIRWGDFSTHGGVISGPINGFWINTIWLAPPTEPNAKPISKAEGAWNTRPGDQFVPRGIRPRGNFSYTFNNAPRDADKDAKSGSGIFFARIPAGRKMVVTKVQNPTRSPVSFAVEVNGVASEPITLDAGQTTINRAAIPHGATEIGVRYNGDKEVVILETDFQ